MCIFRTTYGRRYKKMMCSTEENMALKSEKKKEWQKEYNRKNREHLNTKRKEWVKKNPEKNKQIQRRAELKKKYGITLEQYDEMFVKQGGLCAVCLEPQVDFSLRFAVDHSHKTGKVRGLLCGNCNTTLGLIGEKHQSLQRMVA